MPIFNCIPRLLLPESRQFPFDEVCEEIVIAIQRRNWEVPGLKVEFSSYGSGKAKYLYTRSISGDQFKISFCRVQGSLGLYSDCAATREITIPKQQIRVYEDESGPNYYLYVGQNWENDKSDFTNGSKIFSKMNKKPRMYLPYSGGWDGRHSYINHRAPFLLSDNDLDREYSPQGEEPKKIILPEKFKEFTDWLYNNVLDYIKTFPEAKDLIYPHVSEEIITYSGEWPLIFSLADYDYKEGVEIGKENCDELDPECCHASFGTFPRLVPYDLANDDESIPLIARDGFQWFDTNQNINDKSSIVDLSDAVKCHSGNLIVAVELKYANHVYVVDNFSYKQMRNKIFEQIAPRDRLSDEELGRIYAARGKTIIPITEYKGDYKEPIVLINRELDFDEIAWIQNEKFKSN